MYWLLILTAVKITDPTTVAGIVRIKFNTEEQCKQARENTDFWIKYPSYRIHAVCKKQIAS